MMKTVIMAGGKGTRISSIASDIPKPMIRIDDKPILEYEIESLKAQGIRDFIITISHLGNVIVDYFKDGKDFGVNIEYYNEEVPLGNAGALFRLKDRLTEDFLLINGDALFDIDVERFISYHKEKKALATLFTHPNSHPYDSSLIEVDEKRIWHMGDYRKHGYLGKRLLDVLRIYARNIDVLITEGTMLGRTDECIHERIVSKKMASVMEAFKYVFVLASSTDIERLASIKEASKKAGKSLYVCSGMMRDMMRLFTERESKISKGLFDFHPRFYNEGKPMDSLRKNGFVMVVGTGQSGRVYLMKSELPEEETLLIYSSWDGYYKDPEQVKVNPQYLMFREQFHNVVDIHTSGHADRQAIKDVIETVNPKQAVICIHKDKDQTLDSLDLSEDLKKKIVNQTLLTL